MREIDGMSLQLWKSEMLSYLKEVLENYVRTVGQQPRFVIMQTSKGKLNF